jgi:hypothetical protein
MPWTPGQRSGQRALEAPYQDVPEHLRQPLWDWIQDGLVFKPERVRQVAIALRIHLPTGTQTQQFAILRSMCGDAEFMLDLVEVMLEFYHWDTGRADQLNKLLFEGNSAYTVKAAKWDGLEERVAPGVKELVSEAASTASGSAGDHLVNAWNEAYGRNPDPVKAYSESIKAVEAALAPQVSPMNGKQTLGTMIRDVDSRPSKWRFIIGDSSDSGINTVLRMMRLLWNGQTSRHGGLNPTRAETLDEARVAVHLAATLVQFGISGAFSLIP